MTVLLIIVVVVIIFLSFGAAAGQNETYRSYSSPNSPPEKPKCCSACGRTDKTSYTDYDSLLFKTGTPRYLCNDCTSDYTICSKCFRAVSKGKATTVLENGFYPTICNNCLKTRNSEFHELSWSSAIKPLTHSKISNSVPEVAGVYAIRSRSSADYPTGLGITYLGESGNLKKATLEHCIENESNRLLRTVNEEEFTELRYALCEKKSIRTGLISFLYDFHDPEFQLESPVTQQVISIQTNSPPY